MVFKPLIYYLFTTYIIGNLEILCVITNIEYIFNIFFMLKHSFSFSKFYYINESLNLERFFGIRIFFTNSISLLAMGFGIFILKTISLDVTFTLLVFILRILFHNIEIIVFKLYVIYDEIMKDQFHLLKLN